MESTDDTSADDVADEISSNASAPAPKRKPRGARARNAERPEEGNDAPKSPPVTRTMEELDADTILAGTAHLPKPVENVKTLGDLAVKYRIGSDPEFKMELHRSSPKLFPGNVKADGYYSTFDFALTNDYIRDEYGGGVYRVVVVGPNPNAPNVPKHYESISLNFPGEARQDRVPRSVSDNMHGQQQGQQQNGMPFMMPNTEDPKIVSTTLGILKEALTDERNERKSTEDRAKNEIHAAQAAQAPVIAVHERRADDIAKYEAQLRESEVRAVSEQLSQERTRTERLEREIQEIRTMQNQQPRESAVDVAKGMAEIMKPMFDRPQAAPDNGVREMAEATVRDLVTRHSDELRRMGEQHSAALDAMRQAHASEKAANHQAHLQELQSERDAARRREERLEDQLKTANEERRKDDDRFRQQTKDRDQNWEDRLSQQREQLNQNWEMRLTSSNTSYESRISLLQSEIDRLKGDLSDAKQHMHDNSDPLAIVHKADQLRTALGAPAAGQPASGSGGIGIKSDEGEWKSILAEGFTDRMPAILDVVGRRFFPDLGAQPGQPGQQQAQQPKVGELINHPQYGEVYVVVDPRNNQIGFAPRAQYEQWMRSQGRQLPQPGQQGQPQQRASGGGGGQGGGIMNSGQQRRAPRKERSAMPVPDLGFGLDKPTPRDEVPQVRYRDPNAPAPAAAPAQEQRRSRRSAPPQQEVQPSDGGVLRMSPMEKQAISLIAKMVHKAVEDQEEPEEFVARVLAEQPRDVMLAIVTNYSPDQIVSGIKAVQPTSGGATPYGEDFTMRAFTLLREQLTVGNG